MSVKIEAPSDMENVNFEEDYGLTKVTYTRN